MRSISIRGRLATATAAIGVLFAAAAPARAEVAVSGDPALYWNQVLSQGLPGGPVVSSRGFAMVSSAIHDAVNATTTGKGNYALMPGVVTPGGDTRAATAVAAHSLLMQLNPAGATTYNAALANSLALVPDGVSKTNGMATGAAISTAMTAFRTGDGAGAPSSYTPSGGLGDWAPTPIGNLPAAIPSWANVDPWLMSSPDAFRPGPPPLIGSVAYATAYNEVMTIGSAVSGLRTADQSAAANFWVAAAGAAPWLQAGLGAVEGDGLSTLENARIFALISTSVADAVIGIWDAKYEYDYWRPVTGIRNGDLDGNAGTVGDLGWSPFITTPNHPSYISGHSGIAGAAATVLGGLLGDSHNFCLTASGMTRCWDSYSAAAQDAADSRLWGGIHWRFDNEAGLALGSQVGANALASLAFDAVPEPATWAMMILGFGLAGVAVRRRRALEMAGSPAPG
jgi:hypothetical protein